MFESASTAAQDALSPPTAATDSATRATTLSASAGVNSAPNVNRTAVCATSGAMPPCSAYSVSGRSSPLMAPFVLNPKTEVHDEQQAASCDPLSQSISAPLPPAEMS